MNCGNGSKIGDVEMLAEQHGNVERVSFLKFSMILPKVYWSYTVSEIP